MTLDNMQTISNLMIMIGAIILALGTFGHYYYGQQSQKKNKEQSLVTLRDQFFSEVDSLIKPMRVQTEELNIVIKKLQNDDKSIGVTIVHNLKNAALFKSNFNYNELSETFSEEKKKDLYNLRSRLTLVETLINSIEQEVTKYPKLVNAQKAICATGIRKIFDLRNSYATQVNTEKSDVKNDPFLLEFFGICESHLLVKDEYKLLFGRVSLIDPLNDLRVKYFAQDKRLIDLTPPIMECLDTYKLIEESKTRTIEFYNRINEQLIKVNIEINDLMNRLKNKQPTTPAKKS